MLSRQEQINSKIFAYIKHIRPRHAIIVDQQKGVAMVFCLFVHDSDAICDHSLWPGRRLDPGIGALA